MPPYHHPHIQNALLFSILLLVMRGWHWLVQKDDTSPQNYSKTDKHGMWIVDKKCLGETPSVGIEALLNTTSICIETRYERLLGIVTIQFINEGNEGGDAPIRWPWSGGKTSIDALPSITIGDTPTQQYLMNQYQYIINAFVINWG